MRSPFPKAVLRSTGQDVKILPRITNKEIQPPEYERIYMTEGDIIHLALCLRTSLRFPPNGSDPTGPKSNAGSLDQLKKVA